MQMDIDEISLAQAKIDLCTANARVVELTCRISVASEQLLTLREEVRKAEDEKIRRADSALAKTEGTGLVDQVVVNLAARFVRANANGHVDFICGHQLGKDRTIEIKKNSQSFLTISGWIISRKPAHTYPEVGAVLTKAGAKKVYRGLPTVRDDVAAHLGNPELREVGFEVSVPISELATGSYEVSLFGRREDKTGRAKPLAMIHIS